MITIDAMSTEHFLSAVADFIDQLNEGHSLFFDRPQNGEPSVQDRLRTEAAKASPETGRRADFIDQLNEVN